MFFHYHNETKELNEGFKRAILSTIRNDMLGSFLSVFQGLGKMDKEVLLFWARNNNTVPFKHSDDLRSTVSNNHFTR